MPLSPDGSGTRGWTPKRGSPPQAAPPSDPYVKKAAAGPNVRPKPSPRPTGSAGGERMRGGRDVRTNPTREEMQTRRNMRHDRGDFKTENERAFQKPDNFDPVEDEYGRPVRRIFSGRIKKRVDLKHEGESDEVIYQYTGEGSPTPFKYALDEIYPEKFDDAAGQPSKTLFAKNARMRMVEYFPEKDIKAYLGGEADELMFGHSVSGSGMANDQYEVREVPDLIPQQYMSAAGLTSKELQRNVIKEAINQDGPDTRPHVTDDADVVMYGRKTNRHPNRRQRLQELPLHGFGASYDSAAGMSSADAVMQSIEPLNLKLDAKIARSTAPYLGGEADEVIYGRQMGGNKSELNDLRDLRPHKFDGAAGLSSNEVMKANPDANLYIVEQETGSLDKIELRRGGEMAERLGTVSGDDGEPLRVASTYANQGPAPGSPSPFLGAAGMNSSDLTTKSGSAEQMIFRLNPTSGYSTGGEAAQAMYSGDIGHSNIHKGNFEISSIYPRAFRGVAGASSRNLFKNSPEAGGRHLFSENLKDKLIGVAGAGTDAKPMPNPGGAGLVSRKLFKGHKLQAIGDTPRQIEGGGDADGDGVMDHLRDEEADIVLYGADVPDSELRKVVGISDKNPKAFDGAAGLTSREVFKVMEAALVSVECDSEEHKLGQARFGGELGEMLGERKLEYEVQKLAPDKYKDAAGLTSKVVTAVTMGDDERGKKVMPPTNRASGNPNLHDPTNLQVFDQKAYYHAAGLTSLESHKADDEDNWMNVTAREPELNRDGGEFAATVFQGKPIYEKEKPKSIAGLTSGQIRKAKTSGHEARRLNAPTLMNNGGTESHDTLYGKSDQDYEADGNDLSRIYELPEMMPDQFMGAAGLASKDVFRQAARPFMFGEKTADGLEYGAKHIADLYAPPNAAQLNSAFMQTSHWFEPDQDGQRPMTQEELEQANAAHELAEESRRHALYQSYASYGSDHPVGEEAGAQYYEGHYSNAQSDQHGSGMYPPGRSPPQSRENLPKWAQPQHPPGGQPPRDNGPLPPSPPKPDPSVNLGRGGSPSSPPQQTQQPSSPMFEKGRSPRGRSPRGTGQSPFGSMPTGGSESERNRTKSAFSPNLFEKGSFAARKIEDVQRAGSGETPLSGRGSRSPGRMGGYADFAARMAGAESNRSQRSQRSYRG